MNIDESINSWTFEETIKVAENLMEVEKNMFKWDVIRHLRDFAENYRERLKEYEDLEEQGRIIKLPYNGNYSEKDDSALSKFVATMIYYESLNNRLTKVFGKSDGLLEELVKAFEDASTLNVPKDTFKSVLLTNEDVDRYEEYKQLEEQSRLIKLPCKVGDTVYNITWWDDVQEKVVVKGKTYYRTIHEHKVSKSAFGYTDIEEIGKTVFLTQSEAEAKLKELRGRENE